MNCENCMFGYASFAPSCGTSDDILSSMAIAYAYVPYQNSSALCTESEALKNGTIFTPLNKPLGIYGREFCQKNGSTL